MDPLVIWKLIAGIGFFLYGTVVMDQALAKLSGRSFKKFLRNTTDNVFKALAAGVLLTALLQSSSVIAMITLGFVEASLIPFRNALAVIMGSNLGSTVISWIVATIGFNMNISNLAVPALAISTLLMFFFKPRKNIYNSARLTFGIALLFFGLGYLKESSSVLVAELDLSLFRDQPPIIFVLIGLVVTAIVQTSSATMAIALTALYAKAISFPLAAAVVIGSEVGTSLKTVLVGMNGSPEKKRAAYGNFFFNLFTSIVAFIFLPLIIRFITQTVGIRDPLTGLAFFQSFINFMAIVVFLPLINLYSRWLQHMFKPSPDDVSFVTTELSAINYFDGDIMNREVDQLIHKDLLFHDMVMDINMPEKERLVDKISSFARKTGHTAEVYEKLKASEGTLLEYAVRIRQNHLTMHENEQLDLYMECLRQIIHSAKSVKDIHHNIRELRESENDRLHEHFHRIQGDWTLFKEQFANGYKEKMALDQLMSDSHELLRRNNEIIRDDLGQGLLEELEASTLMNIERELLSSRKALIRTSESLI